MDHREQKLFRDRREAGRELGLELASRFERENLIVLALPRGGVPVAHEVAWILDAPLDVFVCARLDVPGHPGMSLGDIAEGNVAVLDGPTVKNLELDDNTLNQAVTRGIADLKRRKQAYRGERPGLSVAGRSVVLVDEGLENGSAMRTAVRALRRLDPREIIGAVPVASLGTCKNMENEVDDVLCLITPQPLGSIDVWYRDFPQTSDDEVRRLLLSSWRENHGNTTH